MAKDDRNTLPAVTRRDEIDAFLRQVALAPMPGKSGGIGRLIFAIDATASRQPTWDSACHIQAEMFAEAASLGGLAIQMCYFRGFAEFHAMPWLTDAAALAREATAVQCLGGKTQIQRVLRHALAEAGKNRINALVYVGDAVEEDADMLADLAGKLGLLGVPAFIFQEGHQSRAKQVFQTMAMLTRGATVSFDTASAQSLRELLRAVAAYAAGGRKALDDYAKRTGGDVLRLTQQLK